MVDRFVDLVDRRLETLGGEVIVLRKSSLECLKLGFEVCNIYILRLNERQLRLVFEGVFAAFRRSVMIGIKNCGRTTYIFG